MKIKLVQYLFIFFSLFIILACGKTIIDRAYHTESKITNTLENPIKVFFHSDGFIDSTTILPSMSFSSKIEFSDAPTPIFHNADSITIQFLFNGKIKRDLNCNKMFIIAQYPNYCDTDTINIFKSGDRIISSSIDNKSYHEYKVDTLDFQEAK